MRPFRKSTRVAGWVLALVVLALAGAHGEAQAQFFDYGFGDIGATAGYEIYGNPPGYDYVTPSEVYGFGGIDFGYGPTTPGYGDGYGYSGPGFGFSPGLGYGNGGGYGNQGFGGFGNPGLGGGGILIGNPVADEGQNGAGAQGRTKDKDKKVQRKAQPKPPTKPAGGEAARKPG